MVKNRNFRQEEEMYHLHSLRVEKLTNCPYENNTSKMLGDDHPINLIWEDAHGEKESAI
jgi:hypothetical protein